MIAVKQVSHQFPKQSGQVRSEPVLVLKDVSIDIQSGSFTSFLGPSGCGKSTLLRIIDGLIRPSRGEVTMDGRPITGPEVERAIVFQDFGLLPWYSAARNVGLGLEIQGKPSEIVKARVHETLRLVNLQNFAEYFPHQLSGGMKQRVGLARALASGAEVLLMDEPFGALDPFIREIMQTELLTLLEQAQKTVIFVTHSVEEAVIMSDTVVLFSAHPGTVKAIVPIDIPHPRAAMLDELRADQVVASYRKELTEILRPEISITE